MSTTTMSLLHHLPDSVAALDLELTEEEVRALEQTYAPRQPTGF